MGVLDGPGRRVVVGIDCSPESEQVLRWADRQAELTRSVLVALTGWQPDLPGADVETRLSGRSGPDPGPRSPRR